MSQDQMQDVFPISFDFKKGEQPTATKFTGLVKQTKSGFDRITQAVGDPWEYTSHGYNLSPERLAQANLARILGPSDYLSPSGASLEEPVTNTIRVTLPANRNSWNIGFPLIKISNNVLPNSSIVGVVTPLVWGTDITIYSDVGGLFTTEKSTPETVIAAGQFYIDYYSGIITTYGTSDSTVTLSIDNIHMFGAGPSWGTHNVIPSWQQTTEYCTATQLPGYPSGGISMYNLTLPKVQRAPRTGSATVYGAQLPFDGTSPSAEATYSIGVPGQTAQYRLPHAITSASLAAGTELPEGYLLLWDDVTGRIVPQCTFYYVDEYTVRIKTPQSWLTSTQYRLLIPGASVAENIEYLNDVMRDNRHVGLAEGATSFGTLSYTPRLSHDHLVDLYSILDYTSSTESLWRYTKSTYPTNPHPQYMHRSGWMVNDSAGNHANAMRGFLVFASGGADLDTETMDVEVGSGALSGETWGIKFGGGQHILTGDGINPTISYTGGSSQGIFARGFFDIEDAGIQTYRVDEAKSGYPITKTAGAISHIPHYTEPFWLRSYGYTQNDALDYIGASLAFEYLPGEGSYIKINRIETPGTLPRDVRTVGANVGQANITDSDYRLYFAPYFNPGGGYGSAYRPATEQLREFRFRGMAYCSTATNGSDSYPLPPATTKFFTSPGVVGTDFLALYSNAIFVSDEGDGVTTSLDKQFKNWNNNGGQISDISGGGHPSGIFYKPSDMGAVAAGPQGNDVGYYFWGFYKAGALPATWSDEALAYIGKEQTRFYSDITQPWGQFIGRTTVAARQGYLFEGVDGGLDNSMGFAYFADVSFESLSDVFTADDSLQAINIGTVEDINCFVKTSGDHYKDITICDSSELPKTINTADKLKNRLVMADTLVKENIVDFPASPTARGYYTPINLVRLWTSGGNTYNIIASAEPFIDSNSLKLRVHWRASEDDNPLGNEFNQDVVFTNTEANGHLFRITLWYLKD
jgi:hypothetical protein